jgi:CHAD domain-containing protein
MGQSTPTLEFQKHESVRQGSLRLTELLAATAARLACLPESEFPSAVHGQRLLLKRARALLRLLRPALGTTQARRLESRLRTVARALSPARDQEVGKKLLQELATEANTDRQTAVQEVLDRYVRITSTEIAPARRTRSALKRAAAELARLAPSLRRCTWKLRGWPVIEAGLRDAFRRARRRFRSASTLSRETAFHDWRRTVKTVQYQLGFLRPTSRAKLTLLIDNLDRLGSGLGAEHDLALLGIRLVKNARQLGPAHALAPVRAMVANRQQFHRKEALKQGRRLFARRPADFVESLHHAWKRWRTK